MSTDPTPAQTFAPGARVLLPGDRRGVVIGPADGCSAGILAVEVEVPASTTTILTASDYLTAVDGAGTATPPETAALAEVAAERCRQDKKWGEQNHPDGTGGRVGEALAHYLRAFCDQEHGAGFGTWASILAEEVGEAFAEDDAVALRGELVQVAAVAVNWIGAIDRRGAPNEPTVGEALQRLHDKHRGFTDAQLAAATPGEPGPPAEHATVDEMEAHFIDANERMGEALVAIGMKLGLPRPRTGATWGAPEILAQIADLSSAERVETAARVLHDRRHRFGTAPTCGACRDDAAAVAAVLTPTSETGDPR